jgi:hypothetical protein
MRIPSLILAAALTLTSTSALAQGAWGPTIKVTFTMAPTK